MEAALRQELDALLTGLPHRAAVEAFAAEELKEAHAGSEFDRDDSPVELRWRFPPRPIVRGHAALPAWRAPALTGQRSALKAFHHKADPGGDGAAIRLV